MQGKQNAQCAMYVSCSWNTVNLNLVEKMESKCTLYGSTASIMSVQFDNHVRMLPRPLSFPPPLPLFVLKSNVLLVLFSTGKAGFGRFQ